MCAILLSCDSNLVFGCEIAKFSEQRPEGPVSRNYDDLASIAAVDLGFNSFHLIVADVAEGRLKVVDRMRTMVRLAAGLSDDNSLSQGR